MDEQLPDASGSLRNSVPPKAINTNVGSSTRPCGPCLIVPPSQRYEFGKRAAEHGMKFLFTIYLRNTHMYHLKRQACGD